MKILQPCPMCDGTVSGREIEHVDSDFVDIDPRDGRDHHFHPQCWHRYQQAKTAPREPA